MYATTLSWGSAASSHLPSELRDRGTLYAHLGQRAAAVRDWEAYLQGAPDAPDASVVRDRIRALRQALAALN